MNNYNSLESAYADMMKNALNSTASQNDIDITDQQRTLVDASVNVLNAISAAIQ